MKAQIGSNGQLRGLLWAVALGALMASCQQTGGNSGASVAKGSNIVGGSGEKPFAEKYQLTVKLPMPESAFVETLKRLGLQYEIYAERGSVREIPSPSKATLVDLEKIQRVYQIYGEVDRVKRIGEMYWAFVDKNHRVVYVENRFSYTGP